VNPCLAKWIFRRFLIGAVFLFITASARASSSDWALRVWQSDDGLPNNNVAGLAQTADGYIWVTTPTGLARFDGVQFEEIHTNLFNGEYSQRVAAILQARDGSLWLAMAHGWLAQVDAGNVRVFTNGFPTISADTLTEDGQGGIWATYPRANGPVFRIKDGQVTNLTEAPGLPFWSTCSLARDKRGNLWFGKGGQIGVFQDGRFEILARVSLQTNVTRIVCSRSGDIWICYGSQLFRYDQDGHLAQLAKLDYASADTRPTVMLEDSHGAFWVGTSDSGLFRYDGNGIEKIPTSHYEILSLLEDREGNIWVGTGGGGLDQLQPRSMAVESTGAASPFEAVQSICQDSAGNLWAATQNGFLVCRTSQGWQKTLTGTNWPLGLVTCVAADEKTDAIWIGTRSHKLCRIEDDKFTQWRLSDGLVSHNIHTLVVGPAGDLWIGGNSPENVQHFQDGQFSTLPVPSNIGVIQAMVEDHEGNIWVGTSRGVLLRSNGSRFDVVEGISQSPRSIHSLYATADGSVWIGYAAAGLGRYKDGNYFRATSAQGLYDDQISQIVADGLGWLWLGSDHGIFKIQQQEFEDLADGKINYLRSIRYGRSEGLPGLQANFGVAPGAISSRDGNLWIPLRTGLAVIDPYRVPEYLLPPSVLLTRVTVDGQTIASYDSPLPAMNRIDLAKQAGIVHLPPGVHRLEFAFTALSFTAPENVQFRYKLDGVDENWIDTGTERTARYASLGAGNYRFEVKACNSDGIWNETGSSLAFSIAPFFWQTWWFRIFAIIGFTSMVIAIVRYISFRRLQIKVRELQQQAALDKERARIARDLHDNLGSQLTKIVMLSELSLQRRSDHDRVIDRVTEVSNTARQVVKSLDQTVWAVNPRNDTLPELINYIGQFAVEFLRPANIRCRVDLLGNISTRTASADVRHNLFLAVKEALNNVVCHARANEVQVTTIVSKDSATLIIEDNGQGFKHVTENGFADGLRNMQARMKEIGGEFGIESKPGIGTRIDFTFPCSFSNENGNGK
jgi:ligand-binding sensor domain-containing protein/signal transduction histidine kinase